MAKQEVICPQCRMPFFAETGHLNRAMAMERSLYCSRSCAGLARRLKNPPTLEQKKIAKAEYDKKRRELKGDELRAKKRVFYHEHKEERKELHRLQRQKRMSKHLEYCRQPEYRAKKKEYDKDRRFKAFGPFEDAARLLSELQTEIDKRATRYEIYIANGRYTRQATQRRRELWQLMRKS
jgi:hypothetical protein